MIVGVGEKFILVNAEAGDITQTACRLAIDHDTLFDGLYLTRDNLNTLSFDGSSLL
jgi:UV DNA damage repair endonuclease